LYLYHGKRKTKVLSEQAFITEGVLDTALFAAGIFDLVLLAVVLGHSYFAHLILKL
jgi:hypothetical protein